jgi:hypothetical protein
MKHPPFYRRRRFLYPLIVLVAIGAAFAVAVARSGASKVVVYNQTDSPLPQCRIAACGQAHVFPPVPEEASFRWRLESTGSPGEIELEFAQATPWKWRGAFIAPTGGYRVTLRLWPDHEVEVHTQISFWQRLLNHAPRLNE